MISMIVDNHNLPLIFRIVPRSKRNRPVVIWIIASFAWAPITTWSVVPAAVGHLASIVWPRIRAVISILFRLFANAAHVRWFDSNYRDGLFRISCIVLKLNKNFSWRMKYLEIVHFRRPAIFPPRTITPRRKWFNNAFFSYLEIRLDQKSNRR